MASDDCCPDCGGELNYQASKVGEKRWSGGSRGVYSTRLFCDSCGWEVRPSGKGAR